MSETEREGREGKRGERGGGGGGQTDRGGRERGNRRETVRETDRE